MNTFQTQIEELLAKRENAKIRVQTLGGFMVWRGKELISTKEWGRDKTVQLFQYLVTSRHRRALHREQIVDRIWEDMDGKAAESNFKVAMHGVNKALEPARKGRTEAHFVLRQGITYQLNLPDIWIDVQAVEDFIEIGNLSIEESPEIAEKAYRAAIKLHEGTFLPNRMYEDWSSDERERIQVLVLGAIITLGECLVEKNPPEAIRLAQKALIIDAAWEDAYRIQMNAYFKKGNRPMAIKTYRQCVEVLEREFGIEPLPETKRLFEKISQV